MDCRHELQSFVTYFPSSLYGKIRNFEMCYLHGKEKAYKMEFNNV